MMAREMPAPQIDETIRGPAFRWNPVVHMKSIAMVPLGLKNGEGRLI